MSKAPKLAGKLVDIDGTEYALVPKDWWFKEARLLEIAPLSDYGKGRRDTIREMLGEQK